MKVYDIVIVGGNIAAMSAAIYSGMANIKTLQIICPEEKREVTGINKYLGYKMGGYANFYANTVKQMAKFKIEKSEQHIEKIVIENNIVKIIGERKIGARTLIISTKDAMDKVEGNIQKSKFVFMCGKVFNGSTELVSLAGTGCMASINARTFLSE